MSGAPDPSMRPPGRAANPGGRPSPSLSISGDAEVARHWTVDARRARLVAAEVAWLLAGVDVGEVPTGTLSTEREDHPGAVTTDDVASLAADVDLGRLAAGLRADATPVPALVEQLREQLPEAQDHLHVGLTSQDVLDSTMMQGLAVSLADLAELVDRTGDRCAALARTHRDSPMRGRTLLQPARTTTFGLRAATWLDGARGDRARLVRAGGRVAMAWGGAVGTGAGQSSARVAAWGRRLDLAVPDLPWHGNRDRVHDIAGVLATIAGQAASRSRDLVLLGQAEVGEVSDGAAGGSSAMPGKRNPASAVQSLAAARVAAAAAAGLLTGTEVELDRPAGAWQAEGDLIETLVVATGAALEHGLRALDQVVVHVDVMAERAGDDAPGRAGELVDRAVAAWESGP